jgi:DNA polymerase-4
MHQMGILFGRQLRDYSLQGLTRSFGSRGQLFYDYARGIDLSPVEPVWERKSVSCERTFEQDIHRPMALVVEVYHATLELLSRLEKSGFEGRTLTLKVKYADFAQVTRSATQAEPLTTKEQILPLAKQLLGRVPISADHPVRLIGLGVSATAGHEATTPQWEEGELDFGPWP